jgi:phosphate transport system permease protein
VPSVVFGLWGLMVLVPLIGRVQAPGQSLLAGGLVLAMMVLPTIGLGVQAALAAVAREHLVAAAALGVGRARMVWSVALPAAGGGIWAAVGLGFARAVGETMAVVMVCGNIAQLPGSLFDPVRPVTASLALEMGYAGGEHRALLYAAALALVLVVGLVPVAWWCWRSLWRWCVGLMRWAQGMVWRAGARWFRWFRWSRWSWGPGEIWARLGVRGIGQRGGDVVMGAAGMVAWLVAALVFGWLLWDLVWRGAGQISLGFLAGEVERAGLEGGIGPVIASTAIVLAICLLLAVPLGVGSAVWLAEFARVGGVASRLVGLGIDLLASVPSIVFGLFGLVFFCEILGFGYSLWSGGLTLGLMVVPILMRLSLAAMAALPADLRSGAAALGLSKTTTLWRLQLPAAAPGIGVGLALGVGRALSETAALLFTSGYATRWPGSPADGGRALSVHIYDLAINVPGGMDRAAASGLVLMTLLLGINLVAGWVSAWWMRRAGG